MQGHAGYVEMIVTLWSGQHYTKHVICACSSTQGTPDNCYLVVPAKYHAYSAMHQIGRDDSCMIQEKLTIKVKTLEAFLGH